MMTPSSWRSLTPPSTEICMTSPSITSKSILNSLKFESVQSTIMNKYVKAARAINEENVNHDEKGTFFNIQGEKIYISEADVDRWAEIFDDNFVKLVAEHPPTIFRMGMVAEAEGILHLYEDDTFMTEAEDLLKHFIAQNEPMTAIRRLLNLVNTYRDNFCEDSDAMHLMRNLVGKVR